MARKEKPVLDSSLLYSKLKYRWLLSEQALSQKNPQAIEFLKAKNLLEPGKIREHAGKLLASGALAGSLMLSVPAVSPTTPQKQVEMTHMSRSQSLVNKLANILPPQVGPLTPPQEERISQAFENVWGVRAVGNLENNHLNQTYGFIGAEQHLPRYPGDTVEQHDQLLQSGITSSLGGWGYFANAKKNLTAELEESEKYYVAVQTLYLPDWNTRTRELSQWYKYRKVLVVNPVNGKTIVAVIADAGPAAWTGKHFGGSPEVMAYLGLNVGKQKGPVILFFVDDPDKKVSLGPLEYNLKQGPLAMTEQ
ncbi:MAG TPA: hypothetical protein VMW04_04070 [Patescibacteria group bacterium]|nr:hypothetical protein [Patescibacteria group bacterium]